MLFLDANAFYSYFGRKRLGLIETTNVKEEKLARFLDSVKEKALPTSAFIEIMVHFRDDPSKLKEILNFRFKKGIRLYNNIPDYCISEDEITCVHHMNKQDIGKYANKLLDAKIDIEGRFALIFHEIVRDLYLQYRIDEIEKFSDDEKSKILDYIGRQGYQECGNSLLDEFKKALCDGYKENKEKKMLKDIYIEKLNESCQTIDIMLAAFIACMDEVENITSALKIAYDESVEKGFDGSNGTMNGIVTILQKNTEFLETVKMHISEMFQKYKYTKSQADYLRTVMFEAWFDRAQKLRKNDIFDMMCVGCLDYIEKLEQGKVALVNVKSKFISFDATMEKYIAKISPASIDIIYKYKNANQYNHVVN